MSSNDSASVTSQEARSAEEGAEVEESHWGSKKRAILDILNQRFPDKQIPRGALKGAVGVGSYNWAVVVARNNEFRLVRRGSVSPEGSVRQLVLAEIAEKYPCLAVPGGVQTALALKHGVSRQRIEQIMKAAGIGVIYKGMPSRTCRDCNEIPVKGHQFCEAHLWVLVPCGSCGTITRFHRNVVLSRGRAAARAAEEATYHHGNPNSGFLFCKKTCRKERGIAYMREHPGAEIKDVARAMGVTVNSVYQWRKSMTGP